MEKRYARITVLPCGITNVSGYLNKTFYFQIPSTSCIAYTYILCVNDDIYANDFGVHWMNVLYNSASGFISVL